MFRKAVHWVTLGMLVASGLFVALLAAVMAAMMGGAVGYTSSIMLEVLLPQFVAGGAWHERFVLCGAAVGALGGLFLVGRAVWIDFEQNGIPQ